MVLFFEEVDKDDLIFSLAMDEVFYLDFELKPEYSVDKFKTDLEELLNNKYVIVGSEGGGEGGAEYCESVFKYGDKFYKVYYYYYSHQGYETHGISDTIKEVTPKQKTVTIYE